MADAIKVLPNKINNYYSSIGYSFNLLSMKTFPLFPNFLIDSLLIFFYNKRIKKIITKTQSQ